MLPKPVDAALRAGLCECTDNSRKGALKQCCPHVLIIWRCTNILVRLCDKGQLSSEANQPGKDSCRNLWDHFAKEKGKKSKKSKKSKSTSKFIIYNQIQTNKQTPSPKAAWCLFALAQNVWDISSTQQTSCIVLSCNLHAPAHWQNSPKCSCAVNSSTEPQDHAGIFKDMHMVGELHSEERHTLWA